MIRRYLLKLLGYPNPQRDEAGRFVSNHREAVRAKCREQCARMGRDVPAVLR